MKLKSTLFSGVNFSKSICHAVLALSAALLMPWQASTAAIALADAPLFSSGGVPGNLLLSLSVEFPTALSPAYPHTTAYSSSQEFIGYFDPKKCYSYVFNSITPSDSYFTPYSTSTTRTCTSTAATPLWSGNFLNWASMGVIDTFRGVLTGGQRVVDTTSSTVLEKAYNNNTGAIQPKNTTDKTVSSSTLISGATPFGIGSSPWSQMVTKVWHQGTAMLITNSNTVTESLSNKCDEDSDSGAIKCVNVGGSNLPLAASVQSSSAAASAAYYYKDQSTNGTGAQGVLASNILKVYIRVKVCDSTVGVESNCVLYGSNYKPEGLMQTNASKLRYSAFGYLNIPDYGSSGLATSARQPGGVMRAKMKYIGPTQPNPGSPATTNSSAEWSASTGIMNTNPNSADATATETFFSLPTGTVTNSGVMNYLNKFGTSAQDYKTYDPVSALYYEGLRYFKNIGPATTSYFAPGSTTTYAVTPSRADAFPVITTWDDPILYSCQKNFILGIGDTNTDNREATLTGQNATTLTSRINEITGSARNFESGGPAGVPKMNIAGLAYDAHTTDIRSDLPDTTLVTSTGSTTVPQTVATYWLDVWEYGTYDTKNQYYMAAKYGGFKVPWPFTPGTSSFPTDETTWRTNTDLVGSDKRPDNYFGASQADKMKSGLTDAFNKIVLESNDITSTGYAASTAKLKLAGSVAYTANYNPSTWAGELVASTATFSLVSGSSVTYTKQWEAGNALDTRTAVNRQIFTCCNTAGTAAIPFTTTALSGTTHARTSVGYASFSSVTGAAGGTQADYVAYLRGDRSKEISSSSSSSSSSSGRIYRARTSLLGDIVNSQATPIGAPDFPYFDFYNPGYSAFKATYKNRKPVVYVGANDGMLHAFDGSVSVSSSSSSSSSSVSSGSSSSSTSVCTSTGNCGYELFAYIPSFAYGSASSAATTGLANLGSPTAFSHHYFVDSTPQYFDIDMNKTGSASSSSSSVSADWKTVLVGGLGKGGKGYYALDVTDPSVWTSEANAAGAFLWEYTDATMGYSYGQPLAVKTLKYGWVIVLSSGYNNADGKGYIYFINPKTGALLESVVTPSGSVGSPLNMAHFTAYIPDPRNYLADAIYAGDLQGNVWRVDITGTSGTYPAPEKIATFTDSGGAAQPITTNPVTAVVPGGAKRYVMVGTGRLLDDTDIASTQDQSFYALIDGLSAFQGFYAVPPTGAFPVSRSDMEESTNLLVGIGSAPANPMGWYFDFADVAAPTSSSSSSSSSSAASPASSVAQRMVVNMAVNYGIVAFSVDKPSGDVCVPSGTHRNFAMDIGTGKTRLLDSSGTLSVSSAFRAGGAADVSIASVNGTNVVLTGDKTGVVTTDTVTGTANTIRRLNWREVPTTN